jgi:hypothetical protein
VGLCPEGDRRRSVPRVYSISDPARPASPVIARSAAVPGLDPWKQSSAPGVDTQPVRQRRQVIKQAKFNTEFTEKNIKPQSFVERQVMALRASISFSCAKRHNCLCETLWLNILRCKLCVESGLLVSLRCRPPAHLPPVLCQPPRTHHARSPGDVALARQLPMQTLSARDKN